MSPARDEEPGILGCAILQQLERGPCSGYDLKKRFASSSAHAWHAHDTQLYRELKVLERVALVTSEVLAGSGGPRRRVYRPTPKGRAVLRRWLTSPIELDKAKDEFRLRLWTADLMSVESLIDLLRQLVAELTARLQDMIPIRDELRDRYGPPELAKTPEAFSRQLCLEHDIAVARARQEWAERAIRAAEIHDAARAVGILGCDAAPEHIGRK